MDSRDYPQGRNAAVEKYIKDVQVLFGETRMVRRRCTLAEINAGVTLLPALPGVRWRLSDWVMIALGGNFTTSTSVNIIGTVAGSAVQLAVVAIAALTRSAVVRAGASNAVVLADGASFALLDNNTAVTAINVGAAATVATGIDLFADYRAEAA